jgi:hypothetical protein
MMPGSDPVHDRDVDSALGAPDGPADPVPGPDAPANLDLTELACQLDRDPSEWASAVRGLESLDLEARLRIVRGLGDLPLGPGVRGLLRLLSESDTAETRAIAIEVLGLDGDGPVARAARSQSRELARTDQVNRPCLVDALVTAVDGEGRATIGLSATVAQDRRSALFACNVGRGITDATGGLEAQGSGAGDLLETFRLERRDLAILDAPALATDLLAGCLLLTGPQVPPNVARWLDAILGEDFQPRPLWIGDLPFGDDLEPVLPAPEALGRAAMLLEECPSWLDRSELTYELAEEIVLREGRLVADPLRDEGAFRYLFEHRILQRLELYRRMLSWMARFWRCAGEAELSRSARAFAVQLSDEQFAVPGHPFVRALAARSLDAAAADLEASIGPRGPGGLSERG